MFWQSGYGEFECPLLGVFVNNCLENTRQTGRPFKVRFQEHLRYFKYGKKKSKFSQHLLENRHAIGPMGNITGITHITNKDKMMDTLERFYLYKETKSHNQINDKLRVNANAIFETAVHKDPYRGHSNLS